MVALAYAYGQKALCDRVALIPELLPRAPVRPVVILYGLPVGVFFRAKV